MRGAVATATIVVPLMACATVAHSFGPISDRWSQQGGGLCNGRGCGRYVPAHSSGGAPGFHSFVTPPPCWRRVWE
jgi:hypothetical protein